MNPSGTEGHRGVNERAVLLTVGLGGLLVPLSSTMIAVAIPDISEKLNASLGQSGWLVTAYLITMAALQPISGKLGDRYGRRPFLLGGIALFGLTSLGAAMSRQILVLIVFRAGQAIAGSFLFPNGIALLRQIVPSSRLGATLGLLGSSIAFGAAVGPPLGGVLVELGGWPAIFWVNVPIVAVVFAIGWRTLPRRTPREVSERFDVLGAVLLTVVLASGAWLLTRIGDVSPSTARLVGAVIVVSFAAFLVREFTYADPVVQPRFFGRRAFAAATGGIALSNLALYVLIIVIPQILDLRAGWSPGKIGLVIASMSAGMVLLAPIGGRLSDRLGRRTPALAGMALLAGGTTALAVAGPDVSALHLVGALILSGTGIGLGSGAFQTSAVESIESEHAGMAAAASSTSRYVGSIVGTAVLAGLVQQGRFQTVLTMIAVSGIASIALAALLPRRGRPHADADPVPVSVAGAGG